MYISVVTLFVDDIDRAVDFYTKKLGWEKTMDVAMGEGRWVTVAPSGGQASFTLSKGAPEWSSSGKVGGFSGVIMEVDDVYKTHDELAKKDVEFPEPPRTEPWGGWASFTDSEGNIHGLHSPAPGGVSTS
jgi:predicted enzyme related to lactoylglutathione lyase